MIRVGIGVAIGIILAFLGIQLYDILSRKSFSLKKFNNEKFIIENQLKEKKNSQLKEINADVEEARKTAALTKQAIEKQVQEKQEVLENNYLQKEQELIDNYDQKKKFLDELEKKNLEERTAENNKRIEEEKTNLASKLKEEQEQYSRDSKEIELNFLAFSEQINQKKETLQEEINQYEERQKQVIARFQEDEKLRGERDFHKVSLDDVAKSDIVKLRNLALSFSKPEIIYKLIYEVYYKAQTEALFKKVLGDNLTKGGIYKITDITNEKVYVGRTTNFKERWRTHCKRGCGIEKINGLLYDRMIEIGLENFTFEVLEVCEKDQQAEKEKYWIHFYHSDEWGYNQNKGG